MDIYQGQLDEHLKGKEHVERSSLEGETIEESFDESTFPSEYLGLYLNPLALFTSLTSHFL
jgi:hypothetical protein